MKLAESRDPMMPYHILVLLKSIMSKRPVCILKNSCLSNTNTIACNTKFSVSNQSGDGVVLQQPGYMQLRFRGKTGNLIKVLQTFWEDCFSIKVLIEHDLEWRDSQFVRDFLYDCLLSSTLTRSTRAGHTTLDSCRAIRSLYSRSKVLIVQHE